MPPIAATPLHSDHPSSQNSPNTKTSRPTDYSPPAQTVVSQISSCHKHTVLPPYGTLPSSFHPPQSAASERTDTQIPSAPARSSSPPTNNSAAKGHIPRKIQLRYGRHRIIIRRIVLQHRFRICSI